MVEKDGKKKVEKGVPTFKWVLRNFSEEETIALLSVAHLSIKVIQLAMSVSGGRLLGGLSPGAIVNPRRSLTIISQQSIIYREKIGKYYRLFQRTDRCRIFVEAAPV
jgi:hypothetical protein